MEKAVAAGVFFSTNSETNATTLNDTEVAETPCAKSVDAAKNPGTGYANSSDDRQKDPLESVINSPYKTAFEKGHNFLWKCNFTKLLLVARKWKVVKTQATQKRILLARIFMFILEQLHTDSRDVHEIISADYSW